MPNPLRRWPDVCPYADSAGCFRTPIFLAGRQAPRSAGVLPSQAWPGTCSTRSGRASTRSNGYLTPRTSAGTTAPFPVIYHAVALLVAALVAFDLSAVGRRSLRLMDPCSPTASSGAICCGSSAAPARWCRARASIFPSTAASTSPCPARPAAASPRCSRSLGLLDTPTGDAYTLNGKPVANLALAERSRIRNQETRFHLPVLQPDRRLLGSGKCRAAAYNCFGAQVAGRKRARAGGHGAAHASLSRAACGRSTAARDAGPGAGRLGFDPAGRRTHGQSRKQKWRGRHNPARRVSIAEGSTICMVTHDNRFAAHAARQVHLFGSIAIVSNQTRRGCSVSFTLPLTAA